MKKRNNKEILLEDYSFIKSSLKYVPSGGDLLELQGCNVLHLDYKRDNPESQWQITEKFATVLSIGDFDPLTRTYTAKYYFPEDAAPGMDHNVYSMKMIPEGFSFGNPEEDNRFERFVPMSLHTSLIEAEIYYGRLENLFKTRPTLSYDALKTLQESDQSETLQYMNNIVFVLNNPEAGICAFRISKITPVVKTKGEWKFGIQDSRENYYSLSMKEDSEDNYYHFNNESLGKWKIIDLAENSPKNADQER